MSKLLSHNVQQGLYHSLKEDAKEKDSTKTCVFIKTFNTYVLYIYNLFALNYIYYDYFMLFLVFLHTSLITPCQFAEF